MRWPHLELDTLDVGSKWSHPRPRAGLRSWIVAFLDCCLIAGDVFDALDAEQCVDCGGVLLAG